LGGYLPERARPASSLEAPPLETFAESLAGSNGREVSTTMAYVRILTLLMKNGQVGKRVVPIIPDEARTFGMESLFRQFGIYASQGQLYQPHDAEMFLYYKESKDGQILEEGITEAGSMASTTAAGTAYSNYCIEMIPFFTYYSMFGFQRVGDLIWAAADSRTRGFLLGGTAGRTTLAGEGLQHQDGNSHVLALPVPNCLSYDPAFAFELAVIIRDGIRRMYVDGESVFYYLTVMNEQYAMPAMPEGATEGILKGIYKFKATGLPKAKARAQLFGSGAILPEVLKAQEVLESQYGVGADVWSVTSYTELYREGHACDRWNMLHPAEPAKVPFVTQALKDAPGVFVAASDYLKVLPDSIDRWLPRPLVALGTDGFGRSENRASLREFFEVDHRYVVVATLSALARDKKIEPKVAQDAIAALNINPEKANPAIS
jgi:pyruvate dehydrogenase E1 component